VLYRDICEDGMKEKNREEDMKRKKRKKKEYVIYYNKSPEQRLNLSRS
jgi:hypothetical protein